MTWTPPFDQQCGVCLQGIDPDWCWCGSSKDQHQGFGFDNHQFIPMGCDCYRSQKDVTMSSQIEVEEALFAIKQYADVVKGVPHTKRTGEMIKLLAEAALKVVASEPQSYNVEICEGGERRAIIGTAIRGEHGEIRIFLMPGGHLNGDDFQLHDDDRPRLILHPNT